MFDGQILGRIKGLSASKGIKPQLFIDLQLLNQTSLIFEIINFMAKVDIAPPTAQGYPGLPRLYIGRAYPESWYATLGVGGRGSWRIYVELDAFLLQRIEEVRRGKDIFVILDATLVVIERSAADTLVKRVASGSVHDENIPSNSFCTIQVAKSRWLELLKDLGYGDYHLAEIPLPSIRQSKLLAPSLNHLQRAWEHFHDGKDRETLAACYDALELFAKKCGSKGPDQNAYAAMLSGVGESEKIAKLKLAFDHCTKYLHLGRHEHEPRVSLEHKDAELGLLLTHACLAYLSRTEISSKRKKPLPVP